MKKANNIIYWIATIWLSLGMVSTGIVQIMKMEDEVANFNNIGFPIYLMIFIGVAKISGVVAILIPRFPLLKEWAYAGFFFAMLGAVVSHIASAKEGFPAKEIFGPLLLLILTIVSWYFRPASRKAAFINHQPIVT